jgi:hypothetical protein
VEEEKAGSDVSSDPEADVPWDWFGVAFSTEPIF